MTLANIRIVLVEPAGPLNVGSIARVMKNMGLQQLVLVNPHCDPLDAEALQMAVHARDVLVNARQVATVPEALLGCDRAIATIVRTVHCYLFPPVPTTIAWGSGSAQELNWQFFYDRNLAKQWFELH